MKLKKSIVTLSSVAMLLASVVAPMSAFAESNEKNATSPSDVQKQKSLTVDEVLNNPLYKDLTFNAEDIKLFKEIENLKRDNPKLTVSDITQQFDQKSFSARAWYDPYVAQWKALTDAEKALVITTPGQALLVNYCRDKAVSYEENSIYSNQHGNGTQRDAFRHAIWNALMCKYINKPSAYVWASAHEIHDDPNYNTTIFDGFTGLQHTQMDLHNNEKGRDCWNIITDGILWTSDQTLQDRVVAKIQAGEMTVLR